MLVRLVFSPIRVCDVADLLLILILMHFFSFWGADIFFNDQTIFSNTHYFLIHTNFIKRSWQMHIYFVKFIHIPKK